MAKQKNIFVIGVAFALALFASVIVLNKPVFADYAANAEGKCNGTDTVYDSPDPITKQPKKMCKPAATTPTGGTAEAPQDDKKDDDVTCAVEKVGWILCPILESMARISDKMFDVLADNFLRTDTSLFRDDSGTRVAWEYARNLANVMFIVAFLVIIFSQVTNMGISNYGLKKMLPRLVIAAIAVNVSYYICQLIVDLTNILGYEINNTLENIANSIGPSVFGQASNFSAFETGGGEGLMNAKDAGILTVIIVGALASTAVFFIVGPGIAVITMVMITVLAILVILMLRKALIVLLIVVSPIAFVMYLLPNTEKIFDKWRKMFGQLLLVFPIVGLLFGAGQLASTIILVAGASVPPATSENCDPDAPANTDPNTAPAANIQQPTSSASYDGKCDGYIVVQGTRDAPASSQVGLPKVNDQPTAASWTLGLVAVGVAVAPLMAVYAVLKGALSAAGAINGAVSGMTKRAQGAGSRFGKDKDDRLKKRMQTAAIQPDRTRLGRAIGVASAGSFRRRAKREAIDKNLDRELNMAKLDYTSQEALGNESFQRQLAGGSRIPGTAGDAAMLRAEANALAQQQALKDEEKKAAHATIDQMDGAAVARELLDGAARNVIDLNSARTAAMIERAFDTGSGDVKAAIIDAFRGSTNSLAARTTAAKMSGDNPGYWSASYVDAVQRGAAGGADADGTSYGAADQALKAIEQRRFGAEKLATASGNDVGWVRGIAQGHDAAMRELQSSAQEVLSNSQLRGKVRNSGPHIEAFAAHRPNDPNQGTLF